jgi:hypothetical protein
MPSKIPSTEHWFLQYNTFQLFIQSHTKEFVMRNREGLQGRPGILQKYYKYAHIPDANQYKKEARLGELLISDGVVSKENVQECLNIANKKKLAIGKVLVDHEYINREELNRYL